MAQAKILQLVCEVLNFKLTFYEVTKLNQNVLNKYRLEKGPMQNMQIPHIQAQVKSSTIFLVWGNVADHCTTLLLDNQKKVNGWIVKSSGFWDYWISAQVLIRSFQFAILCFGLWFHCCGAIRQRKSARSFKNHNVSHKCWVHIEKWQFYFSWMATD